MSLWQRIKARPLSMHSVLWALLAIVLTPALFAQFYAVTSWRQERIRLELEESKQVALGLAGGFDQYVQDVSRQELALGKAIMGPRKLTAGEISELLTSSADAYKDVRSFYLTDEHGTIRASSDNLGLGTNLFDREYYQELVQGRAWSVSDLLTSRITGGPIIIIAHAVRNAENHLVGVVIAATDPTQLFTSIYHQDLPPQTAVSLYDRGGTLVFLYPSSALAAENPHSAPHGLLAAAMHSGLASGRYYSDLMDQWRLGSAVRSVKTQWYAQVSRSYAYALEPVNNAITISIFLFGALALLAVGLSLGLHRVVLRSLDSLQEQSRRLGRNVLAQQEHPRRIRELAELGEGLNATALNLQLAQQQRQRYLGRLYGLLDASGQLLAESDREELLGRILDQARDLLHCEFACVGYAYVNGSFGHVLGRTPEHLADLTLQPLLDEFIGQADFVRVSAADLRQRRPEWDLRGLLSARLRDRAGGVCGVLLAGGRREHDFVPEDEALLKQYAVIANLALQQAELRAELRREADLAQEGRLILKALLENVPEGIAITDAARENILYLSRYGAESLGGQGPTVGVPLTELPARWPLADESGRPLSWREYPLVEALREGGPVRARPLRWAGPGGGRILECSAAALRDPDGQVTGSLMVWHDVTDQKEFEERLRNDLTNRRKAQESLQFAAAELARSNEDLEQFAYVASHDLQEPLRMVSGYLQLLQRRYEGKLDADADEFIRFAVDGSARMQALILDLLTFSRVQTRAHEFHDVDMETVVRQALMNLAAAIADAQGEITYDPMPTIQGDASQLVQLAQNLISNAIKFRRAGHPVRVHLGARPQEEGGWLFWVKDNGIGIDPAYQDRIFKIFQRLHARDEYPGTGIGLAICKKIVARHGGRIWVESQADQGATFYFTVR